MDKTEEIMKAVKATIKKKNAATQLDVKPIMTNTRTMVGMAKRRAPVQKTQSLMRNFLCMGRIWLLLLFCHYLLDGLRRRFKPGLCCRNFPLFATKNHTGSRFLCGRLLHSLGLRLRSRLDLLDN